VPESGIGESAVDAFVVIVSDALLAPRACGAKRTKT
jgi:hypothetical protein